MKGVFVRCDGEHSQSHFYSDEKKACPRCGRSKSKVPQVKREYQIQYRDKAGIRHREFLGRVSREVAELCMSKVLVNMAEGKYLDKQPDEITLGALTAWYSNLDEVQRKKSYKNEMSLLSTIVNSIGLNTVVSDMHQGIIETYLFTRLHTPYKRGVNKKICSSTANQEAAVLCRMMNKAVRNKIISSNPIGGYIKLGYPVIGRARVLSPNERKRIFEHSPGEILPIITFAYITGMRLNELLGLTWGEVQMGNPRREEWRVVLPPERTKSNVQRIIPIGKLSPLLTDIIGRIALRDGRKPDGMVFKTKTGRPWSPSNFNRNFKKMCRKEGIENFRFHDLRHCAITNMSKAGIWDHLIMAITGHRGIMMHKHYVNVVEEDYDQLLDTGIGDPETPLWRNVNERA